MGGGEERDHFFLIERKLATNDEEKVKEAAKTRRTQDARMEVVRDEYA